jgi:hypothetical protein
MLSLKKGSAVFSFTIAILALGMFFVMGFGSTAYANSEYEWGIVDTYYDDYDYGIVDTYYDDYDYGIVDTYWGDDYGIVDTYYGNDYGIVDTYYDYGCGSYCGGGSYDYGCGSWCGGSTYTTPGCSFCGGGGYSTPRYSAPSSSSYYNSNTVTNTNVNNINNTNIDNSINDSFNNYNSNNTSIVVSAPQTPVYTQPAPYCTITHAQYGGYGSGAYLSWTATNATSAYISQIGNVSVSGSQTVYGSGTYSMTVYGSNGQQATCATTIQNTYTPPVYQQPYVSLTQIPYTGFDFGTFGNAMYWAALASFAIAGAYLMVYYRGGALAFATAMVPARRQKFAPIVAPKAPILVENEALAASRDEVKVQPIVAALKKAAGTLDTMAIVTSKDGSMPKIIIQRA